MTFISSPCNPYFYVKWEDDDDGMVIPCYVDDFLSEGNNMYAITWMKLELSKRYEIKDQRKARQGLGLHIS